MMMSVHFREHDVRVAHNPNSNLKLGSGIANVKAMLEAGIKVGIATDSVASNNNLDMFEEMRIATLLQKVFTKMQQHYQLKQLFLLRQKELRK